MATKQAIYEQVRALMPTTIDTQEEQQQWMNDSLVGKTPNQIETELAGADRPFGINPNNYYHYASDYLNTRKTQGQEFDMSGQVAVTDMMRQLAGEKPMFYDASMGGAVPRDFFGEIRRERTGESGWSNFFSNISNTIMSQAGGFTQLGAKVTDAIGVTENSTKYWQDQMEAMERILAPQGGVSGTMGKLVGNTMFSLLVGGVGTGTGAKTLAKSGWKQALKTTLKESGGVGLAFGISEAGRRFGDVSARREEGQEINTAEEMTYAVAGGAMEAAGEMFGWQIARGMGRGLIGNLPGLKDAVGEEGLKGAARWLGSFSKSFIGKAAGQAPKGGVEEVATAFGQNLVDKFTEVVPDVERPEGLATGLGNAFMMGSLQPLLTGIPLGLASQSMDRIAAQPQEQQQFAAEQEIEALESKRDEVRKNPHLSEDEKNQAYGDLDEAIYAIDASTGQAKESQQVITPTERAKDSVEFLTDWAVGEGTTTSTERGLQPPPTTKEIASKLAGRVHAKSKASPKKPVSRRQGKSLLNKLTDPLLDFGMQFHSGQMRVDRTLEAIDGEVNGPLQQMIYEPITKARQNAQSATQQLENDLKTFIGSPRQIKDILLIEQTIPGASEDMAPLTGSQKVGVHLLSLQEGGLTHLIDGNKYSKEDISAIIGSMTEQELALSKHMQDYYAAQYLPINELSKKHLGREIKQIDFWSPVSILEGEAPIDSDYFSDMLDSAASGSVLPEAGFTKSRKTGAAQPVDIDAVPAFLKNINRLERFKNMLPAVKEVGEIVRNKSLRTTLNENTRGTLPKILDKWLKHSAKGSSEVPQDWGSKTALSLRKKGINYLMGFNILSRIRQGVAICRAMAHSPESGIAIAKVMLENVTPWARKKLVLDVTSKSKYMATRDMEREFREIAEAESNKAKKRAKTTYRRLAEKPKLDERGLNWLKKADQDIAAISWKGFYNVAQSKGMDEKAAIEFADKLVSRTQAAASVEQLPDLFRGGALSKLITTFQNEANQDLNFWSHEIIGEAKKQLRGKAKLDPGKIAYRVLMGHTLPALILGTISRGRLQEDWEEVGMDLVGHSLGPLYFVGNLTVNAMQGFSGRSVASLPFQFMEQTVRAVANDDSTVKDIVLPFAKTIGAVGGLPAGQAIRTAEGIVDLTEGEETDLRRLVWSKWQLEQGKKKKKDWWK